MKKLLLVLVLVSLMFRSLSQCIYTCGTYNLYSIPFSTVSTVGHNTLALTVDDGNAPLPIGFSFEFFCNSYTSVRACTNGWITFDPSNTSSAYASQTMPSTAVPNGVVALFWHDLTTSSTGKITYTTVGTAPNRQCIITYNNIPTLNGTSVVWGQIVLYETTNNIALHIGTTGSSTNTKTQGIENITGTVAFVVPGRNSQAWNASNDSYLFSPYTPATPSPITGTASVGTYTSICNGTVVHYLAPYNSSVLSYNWQYPANWVTTSTSSALTATIGASGTLSVSATYTCGTSASAILAVNVIPSPTVNVQFAYPSPACLGDDVVISVNGASNYTLEPGTYISSSSLFTLTPYGTTQYSIVGTNTANCLSANTAIAQVSVNPRPEILVNSGSICAGDGFTMYPIGGVNYTYTGSGGSASVNPPAGVYSYTVNSMVDGCAGIPAVSHLTVYTMPNIVAMASPANVCRVGGDVESIDLTATGADNFLWSTGETLANLSVNARTIGLGTIVFSVTGTSNDGGGCSKTATVSVNVSLCLGVDNLSNESEEINVYPNPSKGEFILKTEKTISVVVYDLQGKSVLKQDLQEGVHIIHLNEQGSGHYFLKAVSDDGKQLRKVLIKE